MTDTYPPFSLDDDPGYPLRLHIDYPEHIDNRRPLVQWLFAIPYLRIAGVVHWLTGVVTVIAFFAVLFTKRIPRGVFELMIPGLRWNLRGNAYAYFVTNQYPPCARFRSARIRQSRLAVSHRPNSSAERHRRFFCASCDCGSAGPRHSRSRVTAEPHRHQARRTTRRHRIPSASAPRTGRG